MENFITKTNNFLADFVKKHEPPKDCQGWDKIEYPSEHRDCPLDYKSLVNKCGNSLRNFYKRHGSKENQERLQSFKDLIIHEHPHQRPDWIALALHDVANSDKKSDHDNYNF